MAEPAPRGQPDRAPRPVCAWPRLPRSLIGHEGRPGIVLAPCFEQCMVCALQAGQEARRPGGPGPVRVRGGWVGSRTRLLAVLVGREALCWPLLQLRPRLLPAPGPATGAAPRAQAPEPGEVRAHIGAGIWLSIQREGGRAGRRGAWSCSSVSPALSGPGHGADRCWGALPWWWLPHGYGMGQGPSEQPAAVRLPAGCGQPPVQATATTRVGLRDTCRLRAPSTSACHPLTPGVLQQAGAGRPSTHMPSAPPPTARSPCCCPSGLGQPSSGSEHPPGVA